MAYGVPDLPSSVSTRDESTEVEHTMYNVLTKQFVYVIVQTVAVASYL